MDMKKEWLSRLETPCIVIDVEKARDNVLRMQKAADQLGCRLRPHIKTHKMPFFARMQIEAGAAGITCAKVSEAEVMAEGGIQDIFIAYPLVGEFRIQRALALAEKVQRLILAVDSLEGAAALERAAARTGKVLEVRLEIDTGAKRTGISEEQAAALASEIWKMPHLRLTGIYTFKGLVYRGASTKDKCLAGREEGDLMDRAAGLIRGAGIPIREISAGSTPTGLEVAATGKVDEIRPGTYIFNDYMLCMEKAAQPENIAASFFATVVSVPEKGYAVIDGGTKTFPMDVIPDQEPYFYPGYAVVRGNPDLRLKRMNEEHGMLTSLKGDIGLKVGDLVELIPIHICTAINMQNSVYLFEGERMWKEPVAARGMLV